MALTAIDMEEHSPREHAGTARGSAVPGPVPPRGKRLSLQSSEHWEAISSPTRFEILEQMRSAAPCSVAELARQMDRPADGLYHHLRILLDSGLVREIGQRPVGKQIEAIYDLAYDELIFEIDARTGRNVPEMQRLAGALLRLCGRVFDAAIAGEAEVARGPDQNAWCRLDTTWVTDEALAELNAHLEAIHRISVEGNRRGGGQLITIGTFGGPALRPRRADGTRAPARAERPADPAPPRPAEGRRRGRPRKDPSSPKGD